MDNLMFTFALLFGLLIVFGLVMWYFARLDKRDQARDAE